jgi:hypothetical protein
MTGLYGIIPSGKNWFIYVFNQERTFAAAAVYCGKTGMRWMKHIRS